MKFTKLILLLIISIFIQTACKDNKNTEGAENTNPVSKIIITPGNTILTGSGETLQLSVKILDSDGASTKTAVSWKSDKSDIVKVDNNGLITSFVATGRASIIAYADGIESQPIDVTIATPAADIKLLRDKDIISATLKNARLSPSADNTYNLTINKEIALEIGDRLLGAGSVYFGGEIVSLEETADAMLVSLLPLPLTEIFDDLAFSEKEKIKDLTPYIKKEILQRYDVVTLKNGSLQFTLKKVEKLSQLKTTSSPQNKTTNAEASSYNLGVFECHYNSTISVEPISFNVTPDQFVINHDIDFIFNFDLGTLGLEKIAIDGVIEAGINYNISVFPQLDGFVECELELFAITAPIPRMLEDIMPIDIPISVGFRVDGSFQSFAGSVQVSGFSTANILTGIECSDFNCYTLFEGSANTDVDYAYQVATIETINETSKVNFDFMAYSTVGFRFWGINFSSYLVGVSEKHTLATPAAQIADENIKGEYTLNRESGFIPGQNNSQVWDALSFMGLVKFPTVDIEQNLTTDELSRSPLAVKMQAQIIGEPTYILDSIASRQMIILNKLHFDISILPSSENYFTATDNLTSTQEQYNIKEIIIFSVDNNQDVTAATKQEIARIPAKPGQTEFSIDVNIKHSREASSIPQHTSLDADLKHYTVPNVNVTYYAFASTNEGILSVETANGSEESIEFNLLGKAIIEEYDVKIEGTASSTLTDSTYGPITVSVTKNNQGVAEVVEGVHVYYYKGQIGNRERFMGLSKATTDIDGEAIFTSNSTYIIPETNIYLIPQQLYYGVMVNGKYYTKIFLNPNYVQGPKECSSPCYK